MPESFDPAPKHEVGRLNIALGLVAILALGLGFWQLKTLIYSPFAPVEGSNINANSATNATEGADVQVLRNRDTDGDGLSDYDEIYLYHTSAYLKDSDSDGIDDKTEVTQGTDPTCPKGQNCTASTLKGTTGAGTATGTPTADEIRAFLRNNGATAEQLAKYDDATLIKLYSEVSGNTGSSTSTTTPTTPKLQLTAEQKAKLNSMSGAELRALLKSSGVDDAQLSQLDDATLQALVKQVINQ